MAAPYNNLKGWMANVQPNLFMLGINLNHSFDLWIRECQLSNGLLEEIGNRLQMIDNFKLSIRTDSYFLRLFQRSVHPHLVDYGLKFQAELDAITVKESIIGFQKFVHTITTSRSNLVCDMDLCLYEEDNGENATERRRLPPSFSLEMNENKLNISYGFNLKDKSGEMILPLSFGGDKMLHLLPMLTAIKIKLNLNDAESLSQVGDIMNQTLEKLVAICPRLAYVSIHTKEPIRYVFRSSSRRPTGEIISTSREDTSMTLGVIQGLNVQQELLAILNNTPGGIKSMKFENCTFSLDEFNNTISDLTGLKHLEHFS